MSAPRRKAAKPRLSGATALFRSLPRRLRDAWSAIDRADALLLAYLFAAVTCVWVFHEIGDRVAGRKTQDVDERIILALRVPGKPSEPLGPPWVRGTIRDMTALGSPLLLAMFVFAVAGVLLMRRQYHGVLLLFVATIGGRFLNVYLKEVFARPRPDLQWRLEQAGSMSFPSGHAMDSATIYLTAAAVLARLVQPLGLKVYFLCLAVLLSTMAGLSRVYLGVHYPSDVLAGWSAGLGWALLCWTVASRLQRRGAVEQPK